MTLCGTNFMGVITELLIKVTSLTYHENIILISKLIELLYQRKYIDMSNINSSFYHSENQNSTLIVLFQDQYFIMLLLKTTVLLVTVHQVVSKIYFQEIFQDGDAWETRWVQSLVEFEGAEKHYGNFTLYDGGKYAGDKAIKTNQSTLFYAISSKFHETMTNKQIFKVKITRFLQLYILHIRLNFFCILLQGQASCGSVCNSIEKEAELCWRFYKAI